MVYYRSSEVGVEVDGSIYEEDAQGEEYECGCNQDEAVGGQAKEAYAGESGMVLRIGRM